MTDTVYRIAKWNEVFEKSDTRKVTKALKWVAMPTNFSSHGYQCLLDEFGDESPAIYGAWCALVAVAANCTVRGVLSNSRGKSLPLTHLVRMSGFPPDVFQKLIDWASRDDVKWLEVVDNPDTIANSTNIGVPTVELENQAVENTDFPAEKLESGEPPDNLPAISRTAGNSSGLQDKTRQDKTLHNTTRQDKTGEPSAVGRSSGEKVLSALSLERLLAVDRSEVERVCKLIVKSLPFEVDKLKLGRMVRIVLAAGVRSQLLELSKYVGGSDIRKPSKYWDASIRKMVEEAGFDFRLATETLEALVNNSNKKSEVVSG